MTMSYAPAVSGDLVIATCIAYLFVVRRRLCPGLLCLGKAHQLTLQRCNPRDRVNRGDVDAPISLRKFGSHQAIIA